MEFLLLRSFDNYINAGLTVARLDEAGITCYLKDEYTITIDPFLSNALGGIKLMVHPDDYNEAKTLLAEYDAVYRNALSCPQCGSRDVELARPASLKNWLVGFLSKLFATHTDTNAQMYHCHECEYDFNELPEAPAVKENRP